MPRRARSVMERAVMSSPSKKICPAVGVISPMMSLASVVLPPPFGPVTTRNRPSATSRLTFFRMSARPCASGAVRLIFFSVSMLNPLLFRNYAELV